MEEKRCSYTQYLREKAVSEEPPQEVDEKDTLEEPVAKKALPLKNVESFQESTLGFHVQATFPFAADQADAGLIMADLAEKRCSYTEHLTKRAQKE